jgi:hypothetical protein
VINQKPFNFITYCLKPLCFSLYRPKTRLVHIQNTLHLRARVLMMNSGGDI